MYSDFIESPSKDCFSFNDQSSSYDMAEVNETSNQTNLDYIFDSYYSSASQYNSNFELPEDCKNMSFSELFDQELFSTNENKDCQITIKIEKEEEQSSNPCYSVENSQDIIGNHNSTQMEEIIPYTFSLSKSFAPERGINRTSIKTTDNCDVKQLMCNPFFVTDDLGIDQISVKVEKPCVQLESENIDTIEQNIVGMEVKLCCSSDDSQNIIKNHKLITIEDGHTPLMSKTPIPKHQGITRTTIKSSENSFYAPNNLSNDQISVVVNPSIPKLISKHFNNDITQNIVGLEIQSCNSADNLSHINGSDMIVEVGNNKTSSVSKNSIQKLRGVDKNVMNSTNHCDFKSLFYKEHVIDHKPVNIDSPIIKREPEDINDITDQNINEKEVQPHYYSQKNTIHNQSNLKIRDKVTSVLSKNSISKPQVISKKSKKSTECSDVKNLMSNCHYVSQDLGNNKMLVKIIPSIAKCEPKYVNNDIKQKNKTEITDDLQHISNNIKVEDNITSSLSKSSSPKNGVINKTSLKTTKKSEVDNLVYNKFGQTKNLRFDQNFLKLKSFTVKHEHKDIFNTASFGRMEVKSFSSINGFKSTKFHHKSVKIENSDPKHQDINTISVKMTKKCENSIDIQQNIAKMEVQTNDTNLDYENKIKYDGPNEICSAYSSKTIIECVNSHNYSNKNVLNMETEKKKISMEEYRAKRGKICLLKNTSENITESTTEIVETDNGKLKAIKEEFDRNTNEHFIGHKRKIEDEEPSPASKEIVNEQDQELRNKRMKIHYIKNLLPSSFASEIARNSSLMKDDPVDDNENENNSEDSTMFNDKTEEKYSEMHDDLGYTKKEEKSQRKGYLIKVHPSHRNSRSEYCNKSGRSSSLSSNSDDYYNRNRIDSPQQNGQYGQNVRNAAQRSKDQKRVVYIGQIPIQFGKGYLYSRFGEFGSIKTLTLHKKPDFRVYYAFVTYSDKTEAERAISHGNDDKSQVQLDIRFGERKLTHAPYFDLDDEWYAEWYTYNNQPIEVVRTRNSPEEVSFQEELQEFYELAQIQKLNQNSSQNS